MNRAHVTHDDIRALRTEAGAHGDTELVQLCNVALDDRDGAHRGTTERASALRQCVYLIQTWRRERDAK